MSWRSKHEKTFSVSLSPRKLFEINKSNKFSIQKVMQIKNSIKGRINIARDIIYERNGYIRVLSSVQCCPVRVCSIEGWTFSRESNFGSCKTLKLKIEVEKW